MLSFFLLKSCNVYASIYDYYYYIGIPQRSDKENYKIKDWLFDRQTEEEKITKKKNSMDVYS
jgi:hypothetical protein